MVSHLKMQQFSFITIYINATLYDLEKISHLYNQVLFLVIAGKDGRDGVNGDARLILLNITCNMRYLRKDLSLLILHFFYRKSLNEKLNGAVKDNFPGSKRTKKPKTVFKE